MAACLETDGALETPLITNTNNLQVVLSGAHLYRSGSFDPSRYPEYNYIVGGAFDKAMETQSGTQPMTSERREVARKFFLDLGAKLE